VAPRTIIAALFATLTFGQTPTPEMATHETELTATFRTKVSLVLVPVVVRDKKGQPVGTLKKEDFELFDKGKPQTIVKFSVEKAGSQHIEFESEPTAEPLPATGAPGTPPPSRIDAAERYSTFFFDDLHLNTADLLYARLAAEKHLAEAMLPTERVAVYTTSGRISLEFTSERDKIVDTLRRIFPAGRATSLRTGCPPMTYYEADLIINKEDRSAAQVAASDAANCFSGHAPPGIVGSIAQQALALGESETNLALQNFRVCLRVLSGMPGQRNLVLVSPGFLVLDAHDEVNDLIDRAVRQRVTVNTLDARGVNLIGVPGGEGADASSNVINASGINLALKLQMAHQEAMFGTLLLNDLADGTGGIAFSNNDLAGGFDQLTRTPEYTYILGFAPQNLKYNGELRILKVKLKGGSPYTIQARRGYYAPKHLTDPAEQARQDIQEALFSRDVMRDLPVEVHTQYFKSGEFDAKLGVLTKVDLAQLHFKKTEDRNLDNLTIVAALFDKDGNLLMGASKMVELKVRDETLKDTAHSVVTFKSSFDVKTGPYVIRVVVRDSEGQLMAAQNGSVVIP
jgi:VWFA-related protein